MGDLQTDQGESLELHYIPASEFQRLLTRPASAAARAAAFAALARINTLYMIAGAWSGHIGTSFSSLEIMSWLFLNELRDLDKGAGASAVCPDIRMSRRPTSKPIPVHSGWGSPRRRGWRWPIAWRIANVASSS